MKKLKFDKDQRLYWGEFFQLLHCPLSNTDKVEINCGPWCAWFDIEETYKEIPNFNNEGFLPGAFDTRKVITCKETVIGKLVEEVIKEE